MLVRTSYHDVCAPNVIAVAVVVFTLNRSFYPTTSAIPPMSFLIHARDSNSVVTVTQRKNKSRERIKVGKSTASVPGTRAQQKNATREIRTTKKYQTNKKQKEFRDETGYKWHQKETKNTYYKIRTYLLRAADDHIICISLGWRIRTGTGGTAHVVG